MKTLIVDDKTTLGEAVQPGEDEEVLLVRDGHAIALVVPFDDEDLQWYGRERDPAFLASIAEARRQVEQGKTVSHRDLRAQLGL